MKCSNCHRESTWMEVIGSDFICPKCVQRHPILKLVYNRHIDTFHSVLKRLKIGNYGQYMQITRDQLGFVNFDKIGVKLKTTNVVEID
jgi:hypothetical protein